jgi:hypothetical protein
LEDFGWEEFCLGGFGRWFRWDGVWVGDLGFGLSLGDFGWEDVRPGGFALGEVAFWFGWVGVRFWGGDSLVGGDGGKTGVGRVG